MTDVGPTPPSTLTRARNIALAEGIHFAYTGNVRDDAGGTTHCPGCGAATVVRSGYRLGTYRLDDSGACQQCGTTIAGCFDGPAGDWGPRRVPVTLRNHRR
jgi:pyruvate formate lyase activating enzyme